MSARKPNGPPPDSWLSEIAAPTLLGPPNFDFFGQPPGQLPHNARAPDPTRQTEYWRQEFRRGMAEKQSKAVAGLHPDYISPSCVVPAQCKYVVASPNATAEAAMFCANQLLTKLLDTHEPGWSPAASFSWTDPGTQVVWGPCVWQQPAEPHRIRISSVALKTASTPSAPDYCWQHTIHDIETDDNETIQCIVFYKLACAKLSTIKADEWIEFAKSANKPLASGSTYGLWQYATTEWVTTTPECESDLGIVCDRVYRKLLDDVPQYCDISNIRGANHAAMLASLMLSSHVYLTYGLPKPYENCAFDITKDITKGGTLSSYWKLHIAPIPGIPVDNKLEDFYFSVKVMAMANQYTYPQGTEGPKCELGGTSCEIFSYKDTWITKPSDYGWGRNGNQVLCHPFFDLAYFSDGIAKYVKLCELMSTMPWGDHADPFGAYGASYDSWRSDSSNIVFVQIHDDKLGVFNIAEQNCYFANCPPRDKPTCPTL